MPLREDIRDKNVFFCCKSPIFSAIVAFPHGVELERESLFLHFIVASTGLIV